MGHHHRFSHRYIYIYIFFFFFQEVFSFISTSSGGLLEFWLHQIFFNYLFIYFFQEVFNFISTSSGGILEYWLHPFRDLLVVISIGPRMLFVYKFWMLINVHLYLRSKLVKHSHKCFLFRFTRLNLFSMVSSQGPNYHFNLES